MKQRRKFRRTTIISISLAAFLIGLYSAKIAYLPVGFAYPATALIYVAVFHRRTIMTVAAVVIFGFLAGLWRGNFTSTAVARYGELIGKNIVVYGRVVDDPVYDDKGRLDFRIGSIRIDDSDIIGQIRIKAQANGVRRGDSIAAAGKLAEGFANYQASMYYAKVEIVSRSNSPFENLRREFFAAVYSVLPEPHASLGLGFLVGLRSALPQEFDEQLRIVGLTHIVVASGFNLTILVRLSRRLLANYSKYQAFIGSVALILAFLLVTGASPAIVRAAVVTILSLLAWYYGRRFQPLLIILLGAVLTAGFNPLFIWYDIGWWLSFLAFAGVLILGPLVANKLYGSRTPPMLAQVAAETMSAQIMATPLILTLFGKVSVVALIANIAVVPFIPFAMLTTFAAGVAGLLLSANLAAWIALPARLILGYIVAATRFFAAPAWAQRDLKISGLAMLAMYGAVAFVAVILYKRSRLPFENMPSVVE